MKGTLDELNDETGSDKTNDETMQDVGRSNRNRNQRYNIHLDEIGENDDKRMKITKTKSLFKRSNTVGRRIIENSQT